MKSLWRFLKPVGILLLMAPAAYAGGGYPEPGHIVTIQRSSTYSATFQFKALKKPLIPNCPLLTVSVEHQRVPWYSWVPLLGHSSHPSFAQTKAALDSLTQSHKEKKVIVFGTMIAGLKPTATKCVYQSRGLQRTTTGEIYSFFAQL